MSVEKILKDGDVLFKRDRSSKVIGEKVKGNSIVVG